MGSRSGFVQSTWKNSLGLGFAWLVRLVLIFCLFNLNGCSDGQVQDASEEGSLTQSVVGCTVSGARYPTTEQEFSHLYAMRGFLVDDVHIGHDIDLREGTAIYPIACGTVRVYRPATGYGTLVVVIEHRLPTPIMVTNGVGATVSVQNFLSIYGHLRATPLRTGGTRLSWRDGDTVRPDQIIGYVQHAADNGDGEEHLHLGIRLQTSADAARIDASAWFAGYDRDRSRRRWYANPEPFLTALLRRSAVRSTSTWHPPGTVLTIDGQTWLVASEGVLTRLPDDVLRDERFGSRIVSGVSAEVGCMTVAGLSFDRTSGHRLIRFDGNSTVYESTEMPSPGRYTFLAQAAFDSWGWNSSHIEVRSSGERGAFLARYRDLGSRRLREGTLVKVLGRSDVYVVSQGRRRPIFDWSTFLALGYDESWIIEVDSSVLDVLTGPLGDVIRPEDLRRCRSDSPPMDASVPMDVSGGVDVGIDATVDVPRDGSTLWDVPTGSMDAGVSTIDIGRDAGVTAPSDLGTDLGREVGMDAGVTSFDTGIYSDPPRDTGPPVIDSGIVRLDVSPPDVVDATVPVGVVPSGAVRRYEFRLASDPDEWSPTEPYYLRDRYWAQIRCLNAVSSGDTTRMVAQGAGWYRCDTADINTIFVGTFFSPSHLTQGDRGHIATVDNWPIPCAARAGIEWRISELPSGRTLYEGPSNGLSCVMVGSQSRHQLP